MTIVARVVIFLGLAIVWIGILYLFVWGVFALFKKPQDKEGPLV